MASEKRFAVLIDADNVSPDRFEKIFDEIGKFGIATYRRIYGNWAEYNRNTLKEKLLKYALTPVQQFSYINGKNATDITMVIDAMDILYKGDVEGFCLVSNDSDFTRLALRLRESGMSVIGMGDDIAPVSFRTACTLFLVLCESRKVADEKREAKQQRSRRPVARKAEPAAVAAAVSSAAETPVQADSAPQEPEVRTAISDRELRAKIRTILQDNTAEDGWMSGSSLVNQLKISHPGLDIRDYSDLPLFAGKRKIWSTYFLSLGFCENREVRHGEFDFRLLPGERKVAEKPVQSETPEEAQPAPEEKPASRKRVTRRRTSAKKNTEQKPEEQPQPAEEKPQVQEKAEEKPAEEKAAEKNRRGRPRKKKES